MPSVGMFASGFSGELISFKEIVALHPPHRDPASISTIDLSDAELCDNMRAGDQAALRLLMDRHGAMVLRLAINVLSDRGEAEDVAQEVFLSVWNNRESWVEGEARFSTWIHRVAINKAIDKRRRRRASPESTETIAAMVDAQAYRSDHAEQETHLAQLDISKTLAAEIDRLPETQARAVRLYYFDGKDVVSIAQLMGATEQAVRSLLKRGRQALRMRLVKQKTGFAHDAFAVCGAA